MDVAQAVLTVVRYACQRGLVQPDDHRRALNSVATLVGQPSCLAGLDDKAFDPADPGQDEVDDQQLQAAMDVLVQSCRDHACGDELAQPGDGDLGWSMAIMGALMPRPSQVNQRFWELAQRDPAQATDWFYQLCCDADYVHRRAIARDVKWRADTAWGPLQITINLSKPEKDPRAIAQAGKAPVGDVYPACQLCMQNEGFAGRPAGHSQGAHPARHNLRIVPLELSGEQWGLQFSPYAYYRQHCIVMSRTHRPMHIDRGTLDNLLQFVDLFPHYFVGSNADLPIVGGSILSHDHYQGGLPVMPMFDAPVLHEFSLGGYEGVQAAVLKWPVTVLRLTSDDRQQLLNAACHVLDVWRGYNDPQVGLAASSEGQPHHTITPIARKVGERYVLYLALRSNITSSEHPLGVFHPHQQLHHIKRENIGLIEVMGLAILPARLQRELAAVQRCADEGRAFDEDPLAAPHALWAQDVLAREGRIDEQVLQREVGQVFAQVLECAGVFKSDQAGRVALERFLCSL